MLKVAVLAACVVATLAQSPSFGGCPTVPAQSTLDLNKVSDLVRNWCLISIKSCVVNIVFRAFALDNL